MLPTFPSQWSTAELLPAQEKLLIELGLASHPKKLTQGLTIDLCNDTQLGKVGLMG